MQRYTMQRYKKKQKTCYEGEDCRPTVRHCHREITFAEQCPDIMKQVDVGSTTGAIIFRDSGDGIVLNSLLPGDQSWNRIGNKINLQRLQVKGYLVLNGTQAPNSEYYQTVGRFAIVYDKQHNNTLFSPAFGLVFTDILATGVAQVDAGSNINWAERERFIVLYDEVISLPEVDTDAMGNILEIFFPLNQEQETVWDFDIDLRGLPTLYSGSNGDPQDITTGALSALTMSNTDPSVSCWGLAFTYRLYYTDR